MDRNKYQIHIPLPPKIDPTVTMMQVRNYGWERNGMTQNATAPSQKILKLLTHKLLICEYMLVCPNFLNHFSVEKAFISLYFTSLSPTQYRK